MCDNCKVKQRAIDVQRTVIDRQDAQIGRQQVTIGELQTENAAMRNTIANTYARLQQMIDNAEAEIRRRDETLICLQEAGAA
jgi:predicted RNase H-like nuclease (RuvC/YqgF family)